eukprot:jgi/Picre1/30473/NNA_005837.t1
MQVRQREAELEAAAAAETTGRKLKVDVGRTLRGDEMGPEFPEDKLYMVVGFEVFYDVSGPTPQEVKEGAEIVYTYDVYWETSDITWASRWDAYLKMPGAVCIGSPL